jgi:hypothetical protein
MYFGRKTTLFSKLKTPAGGFIPYTIYALFRASKRHGRDSSGKNALALRPCRIDAGLIIEDTE